MDISAFLEWLKVYSIIPVVAVFVLLVVTTYLPGRRGEMERRARIPFADDDR